MTATVPLFCAHADVDGVESACACFVPPGMRAEEWELDNGRRSRILTTHDDDAYVFCVQRQDGTFHDAIVCHLDNEFTAEDARRIGRALLNAAARLDELTGA
jgi:hypothetical protein